ncbi:hypothetical protein FQN54_000385 [Arachnomyces sp. PD_36]|nr:hypothetical protein FQN54_000385 [Arachnomyces sp. PD_36]
MWSTFMLSTVEVLIASLCTSIPTLRPFYLRWRRKYRSSRLSTNNGRTSQNASQSGRIIHASTDSEHHRAWIELEERAQEPNSEQDGDSRRSTKERPEHGIQISKDWAAT